MWNYSFMFPSVLVLATLLVFYFTRPRLPIRINRVYVGMLALEIGIIVLDILSSKADENCAAHPVWLLYALNTLFFVLFLARIYMFFCFAAELLLPRRERRWSALTCLPVLAAELVAISSFLTGAVFSISEGAYHSGPLYLLLHYTYLFYILAMLVLLIRHYRRLRPHELAGYLGFSLMLLAGTVMRRLFPRLLVMNTFSLTALLIIYLTFENPDLYLSDRGQAFNMRGLPAMLNEMSEDSAYHLLGFIIRNYTHERGVYGGEQIDEAITQINLYLRKSFRECMVFYLRGGRFALLGPDHLDWTQIFEAIAGRFRQPWCSDNCRMYLNVGFADVSPKTLLGNVDRIVSNLNIALEQVGQPVATAPNGMVMDSQSIQHLDEQVDILRTLERVVEKGEVEVFLQPVYDSGTRRIVAAEALARIRDDEGRIISPGLFIPIAEKNGFIDRLGESVFEKTCAFIHDHDMGALHIQWINVNLSPIQCIQRDLTQRLTAILERYHVPAELLHLEITEQSIIDYALLEEQINGLRSARFQFVLADYGSGYSNLTRVKHYPFVNIKLDMEVVWDFCREKDSLLPNIVKAFRQMGFTITAEGIETKEMADALTDIGCEYLQGYLFDKPLPIEEFVQKYSN